MTQFNLLEFQREAVEKLTEQFKQLWWHGDYRAELIFHSPTGSGKTFMVSHFINGLRVQPDWDEDVAFVWITFSDDLAMQSKEKYYDYFFPNIGRGLLSVQDFSQGRLDRGDILFLNWQKLVSRRAADRILRRPTDDDRLLKESGYYFEDIVENTHSEGREIVMIIDESHKNVTANAMRDVINPLNPRVIVKVSATPENIPSAADVEEHRAGYVAVKRKDVVEAKLIKREILSQTEDDLNLYEAVDNDHLLLDLAMDKRQTLLEEWQRMGQSVNPLVLIQLPDDDQRLNDLDVKTKEEVVTDYLLSKGVPAHHIAKWFDKKKENLEGITDNNSPVEYLLFKYAAGTGWDCPRAHIIVMFREIQNPTFHTQTLGRILRMPLPGLDLSGYPSLEVGYLYTNYRRNQIMNVPLSDPNKPKVHVSSIKDDVRNGYATKLFSVQVADQLSKIATPKNEQQTIQVAKQIITQTQQFAREVTQLIHPPQLPQEQKTAIEEKKKQLQTTITQHLDDVFDTVEPAHEVDAANIKQHILDALEPLVNTISNRRDTDLVVDEALKTDILPRTNTRDIGKASSFQAHLINFFNHHFELDQQPLIHSFDDQKQLLRKHGIDPNPSLEREVLVNARFLNTNERKNTMGDSLKVQVSDNDVEKEFTRACYELLREQTDERAKIGNVSRSWGPLKEALRQWFKRALPEEQGYKSIDHYKIFLRDLNQDTNSVFRRLVTDMLIDYIPKRDQADAEKRQNDSNRNQQIFVIKAHYAYPDDYKEFSPATLSIVQPFRLLEQYNGRDNEVAFIRFLEQQPTIQWWFKNSTGQDALGFKYTDTQTNKVRIFYPDWIVRFKDNRIGIFDTKKGITAAAEETADKARTLALRIQELNNISQHHYVGGIVIPQNGQWLCCSKAEYKTFEQNPDDWTDLSSCFLSNPTGT